MKTEDFSLSMIFVFQTSVLPIFLPFTTVLNEQGKEIGEKLNAGHNVTDHIFRSKAKSSKKERQS